MSRWARDRELLSQIEPGLTLIVSESSGTALIAGQIQVGRPSGRVERFDVTFRYAGLDPFEVPDCYDEVGRFPREPDRHVEADGRMCLWLPWLRPGKEFRGPDGLALFLTRVQQFIGLQLLYELRERLGLAPYWVGRQWRHGTDGFREWFQEETERLSANRLRSVVAQVHRNEKAGRRCPCGSGKRFSNCHKQFLRQLRAAWSSIPGSRAVTYELVAARDVS